MSSASNSAQSARAAKAEKSLHEKFKSWFKGSKSIDAAALATRGGELELSADVLHDVSADANPATRVQTIEGLTHAVREQRLQELGVELLWMKTKDLLESGDEDSRHLAMRLYEALAEGQFEQLGMMRAQFFRLLETQHKKKIKRDLTPLLRLLNALTMQGQKILHFEEKIGPFLFNVFPHTMDCDYLPSFLTIVLNMIKFNPAYLDPEVVCGLVEILGQICVTNGDVGVIKLCLECFYAIMGYSFIPKEALMSFISTLCRVVNMKEQCTEAWRIMGSLLATHLGHSAMFNLCQITQARENRSDVALVRGAIFFIGMGLWGSKSVKAMHVYSPMTILPTFVQALECRHYLVTYEVTLQLEGLVLKHGDSLRAPGCDCALDLVEALLRCIPAHTDPKFSSEISIHVHNTISKFETLSEEKRYRGSKQKLFKIIDLCSNQRPEASVIRLISYRSLGLYPTKPDWIRSLYNMVEKYFKQDTREAIRIKTLDVMTEIILANRHMYEEDLLQRIAVPFLKSLDAETSLDVRMAGIRSLTKLCAECSSRDCMSLLDVLDRMVTRPLEDNTLSLSWTERDHPDVKATISGLIKIFRAKLCQQPASFITRIFNILSTHLEDNYMHVNVFTNAGAIRLAIFQLFLALRANETFHLGIYDEETKNTVYSPFIVCRDVAELTAGAVSPAVQHEAGGKQLAGVTTAGGVTYLSLTRACRLVIRSLSEERDWMVMKLILSRVPNVLQNKALITRYGKAIHAFIVPLIDHLTSRESKYPKVLVNTPPNFNRSDFYNKVFPVLAAMASYSEFLDSSSQKSLINALHVGLLSKECYGVCIVALTACALEMKKGMYHMIEKVLVDFSKISATKHIATPMLEFLSTLIRLPELFSSFTDTHYMSVFAIALPFTNPFKFDAYTVSLAHHIIIMWFLKCRLSYRQNFVQFIIAGLNSNALPESAMSAFRQPAKSTAGTNSSVASAAASAAQNRLNMDSSQRGRSSSLSESALKARARAGSHGGSNRKELDEQQVSEEQRKMHKTNRFHQELTETCVDILARYMFANTAVQTKRLPTTKFLLKEGNAATWMLHTTLITITTSMCDQSANRGGLCDRCHLVCSKNSKPTPPVETPMGPLSASGATAEPIGIQAVGERKRHQSEFQVQRPSPSRYLPGTSARDDFDLRRQLSAEKLSGKENVESDPPAPPMGKLETVLNDQKVSEAKKPDMCACWCSGWAEIYIRRLSGDVSWMCRIQNSSLFSDSHDEFPLADLTALFQPTKDSDVREQMAAALDPTKRVSIENMMQQQMDDMAGEMEPLISQSEAAATAETRPEDDSSTVHKSDNGRQSCDRIEETEEQEPVQLRRKLSSASAQFRRPSLQAGSPSKSVTQSPLRGSTPPSAGSNSGLTNPLGAKPRPLSQDGNLPRRDRAHTISGPSPRRMPVVGARRGPEFLRSQQSSTTSSNTVPMSGGLERAERVTGISPQFVFLQLYHQCMFGDTKEIGKPILLPATEALEASIRNLDRIPAHETHKIGVLYIGPGQASDETAILRNEFGSIRYMQFLHGLGSLISLLDIDKACTYLGGLDNTDGDGDFAYIWEDDVMQVIFHAATLMPNHAKDPQANKKKRHIGNDYVAIVYNNSGGGEYKLGTVKGQFIYACVVIIPLEEGSNKVFIECRPELDEPLGYVKEPKIVSDRHLSVLVRQLALHCNLASQIQKTLGSGRDPYSSNWLERLRQLKRIKDKLTNQEDPDSRKVLNDFTGMVLRRADGK